jgi:hypothetical protein
MSIEIINDALKYYDSNNEIYNSIAKKMKYVKHAPIEKTDIESMKFIFYDENKKELFTSRVEILGKYYNTINAWVWGWGIPYINKALTTIIRKVFLYGTDIDVSTNPENVLLKNELVTSRFRIEDEVQIDIHCAIASYLAKKPFVFVWYNSPMTEGNEMVEIQNDPKFKTDVTYYTFIIDPPDL